MKQWNSYVDEVEALRGVISPAGSRNLDSSGAVISLPGLGEQIDY
jgi:hypothetical protein